MGTDIWIHIEHRSRKTNKYVYDFEADGNRDYTLFGALAGARGPLDPIYEPRGIPEDSSPEVIKDYLSWEEAHTFSWLTTKELRECLDLTIKNYSNMELAKSNLESYERIYEYMKRQEDEGKPCRIVFWFDDYV